MSKDFSNLADSLMNNVYGIEDEEKITVKGNDHPSEEQKLSSAKSIPAGRKKDSRKKTVISKIKNSESYPPARYEFKPDNDLDYRFRKYKFDTRMKTNEVLLLAIDEFLNSMGY